MTRLERFRVQRYGHFDDITVTFGEGCTVVYGDNEAGKSTLLDALGDFLWGFPARNHPREFVYKRSQMLLEATVVGEGEGTGTPTTQTYTRQATKFHRDGEAIDAPVWAVDLNRRHWDHAYGLNLQRLERGGQEVVRGRDDPGGISFLADTGLPIDDVMMRISERRNELFGSHANNKKSAIRQLLVRLTELDERIADLGASAKDVDDLQRRLESLESDLRGNAGRAAELDTRITVVKDLLNAYDHVLRLRQLDAEIGELLGQGPILSEDLTDELHAATIALTDVESQIATVTSSLDQARRELASVAPRPDVLAHTADIRAAVREIEARQDDMKVLQDSSAAARQLQEVVNLLEDLGESTDDLAAARRRVALPVDRQEQLDRQAKAWDDAKAAVADQRQRVRDTQASLEQEHVLADGSEALVAQQKQRDRAWAAVRTPWLSGELPEEAQRIELATRVDVAIEGADAEAERAAAVLERLGELRGKRQQAQAALAREQALLTEAQDAEAAAKKAWAQLVKTSGLPAGLDPTAWQVRAALLRRLTQVWQSWQEEQARHQAASERLNTFTERVSALSEVLSTPSGDVFTDLDALDDLLNEAEDTEAQIRTVHKAIADGEAQLAAAETDSQVHLARIQEIVDGDDPVTLLSRSLTHHQLQTERAGTARLITVAAPSLPNLDELVTALGSRDRSALRAEEAELSSQRVALTQAVTDDERAVGAAQSELSALQHKDSTAALLAERHEVAAQIVELAEQYRSLHVQELILHNYAKLSAERSDTPILERAGEYLRILTAGRHQGFSVETIGADKHLRIKSLVGDTIADIEPAKLSDGTEHQVYFALRLAGIAARQEERRRKGQPTVPVVLDDVFQAFDDERSATALALLAELGRDFQIIVMTHEGALFDMADAMPQVQTVRLAAPRVPVEG